MLNLLNVLLINISTLFTLIFSLCSRQVKLMFISKEQLIHKFCVCLWWFWHNMIKSEGNRAHYCLIPEVTFNHFEKYFLVHKVHLCDLYKSIKSGSAFLGPYFTIDLLSKNFFHTSLQSLLFLLLVLGAHAVIIAIRSHSFHSKILHSLWPHYNSPPFLVCDFFKNYARTFWYSHSFSDYSICQVIA